MKRFLWLWLPPLILFLCGLQRTWLTGQADPWDWSVAAAILLAGAGWLLARRGWRVQGWVALGGVGMALIFCMLAAGRAPDGLAAAGLLVMALLAVFGGAALRQSLLVSSLAETWPRNAARLRSQRTDEGEISSKRAGVTFLLSKQAGVGVVLLLLCGLILWRGPAQPVQPVPDRPRLAVITGLPLFWDEAGRGGPRDAPIVTLLRTRFTVAPLDDPLRLAASGTQRLLLAQPRALSPAQLVAIDRWVRAGGAALVLADPLLRWPSALPPGDRRRPPSTDLLQPLLRHWGFIPVRREGAEVRHFLPDGALLTLSGAQLYRSGGGDFGVDRRRIGQGEVVLLGDADAIDDRLWLADPARPLDPRRWVADTPARVVRWLNGAPVPDDRRWLRAAMDVRHGLRWALLAGIIWAIMGVVAFRRENGGRPPGTKRESVTNIDRKSS